MSPHSECFHYRNNHIHRVYPTLATIPTDSTGHLHLSHPPLLLLLRSVLQHPHPRFPFVAFFFLQESLTLLKTLAELEEPHIPLQHLLLAKYLEWKCVNHPIMTNNRFSSNRVLLFDLLRSNLGEKSDIGRWVVVFPWSSTELWNVAGTF